MFKSYKMYPHILQKNYFLFIIIVLSFSAYCTENLEQFYSIPFLSNYTVVRECLKEHGFKNVTFKSSDNITLHGLFLERPHATCNVIVCPGFFPGIKESMATFYALLPEYCNILFFDARGHGASEGHLFKEIWRYGINEYKDILGAISYTAQLNKLPIIICGVCAGAFNATHALINLETLHLSPQFNIKGLIFDSGWGSVTDMSCSVVIPSCEKLLLNILTIIYKTKDQTEFKYITQFRLDKAFYYGMQLSFQAFHSLFVKPFVEKHEKASNLFDKIHHIKTPIFFIHSQDDAHTKITNVIKLSMLTPNKQCWWIKESLHAQHYLVHRELYKKKLAAFIESVIQT